MIIGIDPGITGAVAAIYPDDSHYYVYDIPTMANGKGSAKIKSKVDAAGLVAVINKIRHGRQAVVYLERTSSMPGQGVSSMYSMGDTFGCIRGVCAALSLPVHIITPQSWKKHHGVTSDKEQVRAKAIELFPDAPLSRKKDHNRAEALLIAAFGLDKGD